MKRKFVRFAVLIFLAVPLTLMLFGCQSGYRSISVAALSGSVSVDREGQSAKISAYEGMKLQDQDVVTVSDSGNVVLKLDDDKYVYLESDTQIKITATDSSGSTKTDIKLLKGTLSSVIEKKLQANESFSVTVDNVSMVVRGTIFRITLVSNENGDATVTVQTIEGDVAINTGDNHPEALSANFQDVILLNDTGGTFESINSPIDYTEIPPDTLQWIREALQDKLEAATNQDDIETLNEIITLIGTKSSPDSNPTPVPALLPTETLLSTATSAITPSASPTRLLTGTPTKMPSALPTCTSTEAPEIMPSVTPSRISTETPTIVPSATPSRISTETPTIVPSAAATRTSTETPTMTPSAVPTSTSTETPTIAPSVVPTSMSTETPTISPSVTLTTQPTYVLTVIQPDHGTINAAEGSYEAGTQISAEAIPDNGYRFAGWLVNGNPNSNLGEETSIIFIMPASDVTLSAEFELITYSLSYGQPCQCGGTISMADGQYAPGEIIHITATPDQGMMLASLVINDVADNSYQGMTEIDYVMPAEDVFITAIFQSTN